VYPVAEPKRFDAKQFDAWRESMEGRRDEEERSADEVTSPSIPTLPFRIAALTP